MKRARRSAVWDHFSRKDDKVHCSYCDAVFTYHSTTSPLIYHLRNIHPNVNSSEASTSGGLQQQTIHASLARRTCDDKWANEITSHLPSIQIPQTGGKTTQRDTQDLLAQCNLCAVGTESIETPLNFSLFVSLQPFAKIKKVNFISY